MYHIAWNLPAAAMLPCLAPPSCLPRPVTLPVTHLLTVAGLNPWFLAIWYMETSIFGRPSYFCLFLYHSISAKHLAICPAKNCLIFYWFQVIWTLSFQIPVKLQQMPKRLRAEDRRKSMPMYLGKSAVETPKVIKWAVVKELVRQGKVAIHKKKWIIRKRRIRSWIIMNKVVRMKSTPFILNHLIGLVTTQ